tara:strand:+ start:477 stop:785 length:309 start_codon:yes stop_codon:yes gene_type:complete
MAWKILGMEHVLSNGWIQSITASFETTDGNAFDRKTVFVEYANSGTPTYVFADLTEADVLQMVFTDIGTSEKADIEFNVNARAAALRSELENPTNGSNLPWE